MRHKFRRGFRALQLVVTSPDGGVRKGICPLSGADPYFSCNLDFKTPHTALVEPGDSAELLAKLEESEAQTASLRDRLKAFWERHCCDENWGDFNWETNSFPIEENC